MISQTSYIASYHLAHKNALAFRTYANKPCMEKIARVMIRVLLYPVNSVRLCLNHLYMRTISYARTSYTLKALYKHQNHIEKTESLEIQKTEITEFWSNKEVTFSEKVSYPPIDKAQEIKLNQFAELMNLAQKRLTDAGIPCWIDAGTLLGIYRHGGKQLPHDYDIDLCILQRDSAKAAKVLHQIAKENKDLYSFQDLNSHNPGRFLRMWIGNGIVNNGWMGIESYVVDGQEKTMDMCYGKDKVENVFPLVQTEFYGNKLWIPKNTEAHLHSRWKNLNPISFWSKQKNKFVLDIQHPNAEAEKEKIKKGKVKGEFYIPNSIDELNQLKV